MMLASSTLMYWSSTEAIICSLSASHVSLKVVWISFVWCYARIASCALKGLLIVRLVVGFAGVSLGAVGSAHAVVLRLI